MPAHCATEPRSLDTIRLRRIFGIGDASPGADDAWAAHWRSRPRRKPPPSHSKSAAVVPGFYASSRIVHPPFRLFDPFSARLGTRLRLGYPLGLSASALKAKLFGGYPPVPTHGFSTAPVRTPVATEFNSREHVYSSIKRRVPSIRNRKTTAAWAHLCNSPDTIHNRVVPSCLKLRRFTKWLRYHFAFASQNTSTINDITTRRFLVGALPQTPNVG